VKRAAVLLLVAGVARAQVPELAPVPMPDLPSLIATAPACDAARATCIGLRLHVPITDAGPIAQADWVARQLASANKHFEPLDVGFQIVGIEPLPASADRVEDKLERQSFAPLIKGRVIDIFVTGYLDDIDKPDAMIYGVTWWTTGDRKYIILSTQAWERTLAHELGHVFGLPHSKFAISIMNKTPREEPPIEERTFHDKELAKMKPRLRELIKNKTLENLASKK
jgi:hypothetical protein